MTISRPSTPSTTTPRKPLTSTTSASSSKPSSRASSTRASTCSPTKSSINNSNHLTSHSTKLFGNGTRDGLKSTRRSGEGLQGGRTTSPTKRMSGFTTTGSPTKGGGSSSRSSYLGGGGGGGGGGNKNGLGRPSTSTSSFGSISSTTPRRTTTTSIVRDRSDMTVSSSTTRSSMSTNDEDEEDEGLDLMTTDDDREREDDQDDRIPRRKAGFGPLSSSNTTTPRRNARMGITRTVREEIETETEGEGGFLTAEEGLLSAVGGERGQKNKLRGSIVERSDGEEASETETETEEQEEEKDGKKENVVVVLRVRPTKRESSTPSIYQYSPTESTLTLASNHPTLLKRGGKTSDEYEYRFDGLYVAPDPTEKLYDRKIRPVVKAALNGFNGTVFAYGQTASGKTHTMSGDSNEPGIIPLAIDELFSFIHKQNTDRRYSLRVSFLEIWNEQLIDLLASSHSTTRHPEIVEGGTVKNLEERAVSMPNDVLELLREGGERRKVGATDFNERSSRSHCVFTVTIESMSKFEDGTARTSRLNLIDLAGSESATGQAERRNEGKFINKSLLTLGTVIGKLTEPNCATAHIPYRDSKLTRLLQPALSGNSRVAVVCTVSPDVEQSTETLSTLKFAKRAKMVVTKAERGVLVTDQMKLKEYAAQVERLQTQIRRVEGGEILRERDLAARRADEAERRGKEAQDALAEKELELSRLRSQLAHTQSLILTGPTLEANARRVSGSFVGSMLSPSRSRSLNYGNHGGIGGGKRVVSDMSGLGLGTPSRGEVSWRSGLSESVSRLEEEEEHLTEEKEAELARQLEEATNKLASLSTTEDEVVLLRNQLQQLQRSTSLARLDAEKSAQASEDRKSRIRELEHELATLRERLRCAEEERDRLVTEMESLKNEMSETRKSNEAARKSIEDLESKLSSTSEEVRSRDRQVVQLEATVSSIERQLAQKEADSKLPDPRDSTIASYERQVESIRQELAVVTATKSEAIQAALEQASDVRRERDLALLSVEEAQRRVKEVEELAELQATRHEAAEQQTLKEKEAATNALQAEVDRLNDDLAAKVDRVAQLQRSVDAYERLEAQRNKYEADQRYGTDKLKSRMAELQARTGTPTPATRPPPSASSTSTLSSSTSSNSDETSRQLQVQQQQTKELQIRNGELLARLEQMQQAIDTSASVDRRERRELEGKMATQKRKIVETEEIAEDWKQKYLAAQRLLDKLSGNSHLDLDSTFTSSSENVAPSSHHRPSLSEINFGSDSSRSSLSASTTSSSRRPHYHSSSSSLSSLPSRGSHLPPLPPPASPGLASTSSNTGHWVLGKPPPLPSSPHQKRDAKERKTRRETIAKDLAKLQQVKVVDQRREGWSSSSSPTKTDPFSERGGGNITPVGLKRTLTNESYGGGGGTVVRERKSSWE